MRGNRVTSGQFFKHQHTSCGGGMWQHVQTFFFFAPAKFGTNSPESTIPPRSSYLFRLTTASCNIAHKKILPSSLFYPSNSERNCLNAVLCGETPVFESDYAIKRCAKKRKENETPNCFSHASYSRIIGCAGSFGFSLFLPTSLSRFFLRIRYT